MPQAPSLGKIAAFPGFEMRLVNCVISKISMKNSYHHRSFLISSRSNLKSEVRRLLLTFVLPPQSSCTLFYIEATSTHLKLMIPMSLYSSIFCGSFYCRRDFRFTFDFFRDFSIHQEIGINHRRCVTFLHNLVGTRFS